MILAMPFAEAAADGRPAPGFVTYLLRRVSRIEPPYVICMLTFFALSALRHGGVEDGEFRRLGASLVYVHQLVYRENSAYNPVTWSLELEVYFYLLAPFLFAVLFRSGAALRAVLIAGLAGLCAASADTGRPLDFEHQGSLVAQGNYFLAGILVADLETRRRGREAGGGAKMLWDIAIVLAVVSLWWLLRWDSPFASKGEYGRFGLLLRPALVAVLCLGVLRGRVFHAVLTLPWIAVIGGMCYTLYLWHYPFMRVLQGRLTGLRTGDFLTDYAVQSAILIAATIAAGAVLFVLFEKPFMHRQWPSRLLRRLRGQS
jgi:peptidoglycan/LPS O-acetylase OafA/YrhL